MIMYRTAFGKIERIEILRETEKQVVYFDGRERKEAKRSDYQNWHDSFEDAKKFLINERNRKIDALNTSIKIEKEKLERILLLSE